MPDLRRVDKSATDVQIKVCSYLGVPIDEVRGRRRKAHIAECRKIITYFLRKRNKMSQQDTAKFMGYANHTNIIYNVRSITDLAKFDIELKKKLDDLTELLK